MMRGMRGKQEPVVLRIEKKGDPLGEPIAMNRAARRAFPHYKRAQKIDPIRKDARGRYYRENPVFAREREIKIREQRKGIRK